MLQIHAILTNMTLLNSVEKLNFCTRLQNSFCIRFQQKILKKSIFQRTAGFLHSNIGGAECYIGIASSSSKDVNKITRFVLSNQNYQ